MTTLEYRTTKDLADAFAKSMIEFFGAVKPIATEQDHAELSAALVTYGIHWIDQRFNAVRGPTMNVRQRVFESLDNAIENGYFEMRGLTPELVAEDLLMYDADLEKIGDVARLVPHVNEWQSLQPREDLG